MHSEQEIAEVQKLARRGLNNCQIARATGLPRTTVRDWVNGRLPRRNELRRPTPWVSADSVIEMATLQEDMYAYLLGMYLGDGCISSHPDGKHRLRVTLDARYRGIIRECAAAMRAVMPFNVVHVQKKGRENAVEVGCYSAHWPLVFPQHGRGLKHRRKIELVEWQEAIVERHPKHLLRGLIHSDGCRCINKSMGHEYIRYFFSNASDDIRGLFARTCDQLGIGWRQPTEREISIARRPDVEFLDEFIGPKY